MLHRGAAGIQVLNERENEVDDDQVVVHHKKKVSRCAFCVSVFSESGKEEEVAEEVSEKKKTKKRILDKKSL